MSEFWVGSFSFQHFDSVTLWSSHLRVSDEKPEVVWVVVLLYVSVVSSGLLCLFSSVFGFQQFCYHVLEPPFPIFSFCLWSAERLESLNFCLSLQLENLGHFFFIFSPSFCLPSLFVTSITLMIWPFDHHPMGSWRIHFFSILFLSLSGELWG